MVRINKYLSQCNLGSRRKVESFILEGKVKVNGSICTDLSFKVDEKKDEVTFEGKIIKTEDTKIYIMLNKPKNYLVSHTDQFDRKVVYSLLPNFNLFSVGRLDYMSEGLLLLTNDGDFANSIIHPRFKLKKHYTVKCKGKLSEEQINKLKNTTKVENQTIIKPLVEIKSYSENSTTLKIIIFEGKKRQIRKMIKNIDSNVISLKRTQIGKLKLENLPIGMWRFLTPREIENLWKLTKKFHVKHIGENI